MHPLEIELGQLRGLAVAPLDEQVGTVLRAIKDHGRTALLPELSRPMAVLLRDRFSQVGQFVAVPSARGSIRRRGFNLGSMLARSVSKYSHFENLAGLKLQREPKDQRHLTQAQRSANLAGSMAWFGSAAKSVVLIDDVVTTGSTLLEAGRALSEAQIEVAGFVCFAQTPKIFH